MKNIKKIRDKILRKQPAEERPTRITNETVAEHREKILAGGRRFKYPVQVTKHRLAIISVIIGVLAVLLLIILAWQQLYIGQNTSKLLYRVTEIVPVSVAQVDGTNVRYSNYLKKYRSSIYYLEQQNSINLRSADGKRQSDFIKRRELDSAERDTYAIKVAGQRRITVTNKEVDEFINKDIARKNISLEAYEKTVLNSFYDWSLSDYRTVVKTELLKRKVRFAVDTAAERKAQSLLGQLRRGDNFAELARAQSDDEPVLKGNGGEVGTVNIDNEDPSGIIAVAQSLQPGQLSDVIKGADGYYIIKLSVKNATSVTYAQIKVRLTTFEENFTKLREDGKIKEYIDVKR